MLENSVCTDLADDFAGLLERFAVASGTSHAIVMLGIAKVTLDDVFARRQTLDLKLADVGLARRVDGKNEDFLFVLCGNGAIFEIAGGVFR